MKPELRIYVGQPVYATIGGWIELPMDEEELEAKIKELTNSEEYIIADYETNMGLKINEYTDALELNQEFEEVNDVFRRDIDEDMDILTTAISVTDSLDEALNVLRNGNYNFFRDVGNETELGEKIVENGYIDIPEHLENYIDFEAIGIDWNCNGCVIDTDLRMAMQILHNG